MPTPADLLPAVLAAPDDDLPRLVYADALEEAGDAARAEFIRVQIELAREPGRIDLKAREAALLAIHGEEWLAPLRQKGEALESRSTHGQFRRGFIEIVWMPAIGFVKRAGILFERTPVRELRVLDSVSRYFENRRIPVEYYNLLLCPEIRRLRILDLSDREIGDEGVQLLLSRPLTGLKQIRLRACNLTDLGVSHFLSLLSHSHISLDELDISLNEISLEIVNELRDKFGAIVVRFDPPPPTGSTPAPPGR
jgi:uncharacterized protein (TIGR02996 family)